MMTLETFPLRNEQGWIPHLTLNTGSKIVQVDMQDGQPVLHVIVYTPELAFLKFLNKQQQETYNYRIEVTTTGENVGERLRTPMQYRGMFHWEGKPYLVWSD